MQLPTKYGGVYTVSVPRAEKEMNLMSNSIVSFISVIGHTWNNR